MVVYIFVEVEGLEYIKRVGEIDLPWDGSVVLENRQQVCSVDNRINVHNTVVLITFIMNPRESL